jgi:hypothetical protein
MSRARRALGAMALLALSVVVALVLAEFAIRPFVSVPITAPIFVLDEHTDYRNRANARERTHWRGVFDYRWTTNSRGFRGGREYAVPKPAGVRRVLLLGDSFTFGLGVNDDQTYAALIERKLGGACGGSPLEVINAGVSAFSTSQEVVLLEREGLALDPELVIVGYFVNDADDNLNHGVHDLAGDTLTVRPSKARPHVYRAKRIANAIPGYSWLTRHSVLLNWLRQLYFSYRPQDLYNNAAAPADLTAPAGAPGSIAVHGDPAAAAETDARKWRLMERLYARIDSLTRARGARLLVALIPHIRELQANYDGAPDDAENIARMRRICSTLALHCVDLSEWLARERPAQSADSFFIPRDGHLAAIGHAAVAEALHPAVARLLNCPPAAPRQTAATR